MDPYRRKVMSALSRMTEQELGNIKLPAEFVLGTPRKPKQYGSRRELLIAITHSALARMDSSQMMQLRIPARLLN